CGVRALWELPSVRQQPFRRRLVVVAVSLFCLANLVVIQTWIGQHIANGHFRRGFVTALEREYVDLLGPDALVWIEVPEEKYTDLATTCQLVFQRYYVPCVTYVAGEPPPAAYNTIPAGRHLYQLQATDQGIIQRYPTVSND
ncbi:MAG: hypothetical protein KDE19_21045, partial [Caldilineaceae bacterium]|nr:hypothetical protein [Caldilineaceae bacterium]